MPLTVAAVLGYLLAIPGLAWSPFAALITWRMARSRGLNGWRYALTGAAFSVFLLLPWLLLVTALRKRYVSDTAVRLSYAFLYIAWLVGPIIFWGQSAAQFEFLFGFGLLDGPSKFEPYYPLWEHGVFLLMILMWAVLGIMSLRIWNFEYDVTDKVLMSPRYILPFALAWGCTIGVLGYAYFVRE